MIITVTLNPAVDVSCDLTYLRRGEINRSLFTHTSAGGKGINVSRTLSTLGVENRALITSGGETGRLLEGLLYSEGLAYEGLNVGAPTRVNIKLGESRGPHFTEINAPGAPLSPQELSSFAELLAGAAGAGDCVVLCGSLAGLCPPEYIVGLMALCRDIGAYCAVDTSGEGLRLASREGPLLIKPNERELLDLCTPAGREPSQIAACCRPLLRAGVGGVLVTLGERGALYCSPGLTLFAPGLEIEPLTTCGAGDAFLGGFLWGITQGMAPDACLRMASACAAARVSLPRRRDPAKGEILALYQKIEIREL